MAAKQANVVKYEPMALANFPQHISPKLNFVKKYLKKYIINNNKYKQHLNCDTTKMKKDCFDVSV